MSHARRTHIKQCDRECLRSRVVARILRENYFTRHVRGLWWTNKGHSDAHKNISECASKSLTLRNPELIDQTLTRFNSQISAIHSSDFFDPKCHRYKLWQHREHKFLPRRSDYRQKNMQYIQFLFTTKSHFSSYLVHECKIYSLLNIWRIRHHSKGHDFLFCF